MNGTHNISALVAAINREYRTSFVLLRKMDRGVNGAWLVEKPGHLTHIIKLASADDVTGQIQRSAHCAKAVNGPGTRTPNYEMLGFMPGFGSWYVQELLPGIPAPWPSRMLVHQLINLNHRQKHQAVDADVNWSKRVLATLFQDSQGWQARIAGFGTDGRRLVDATRTRFEQYRDFDPPSGDIVHGDFQHYNALVEGGNELLSGYVDWEGAGCGDRAIDLARLLYDVYVAEPELNYPLDRESVMALKSGIEALSGRAGLTIYMAYWILQVADFGVKVGHDATFKFMKTGWRILSDLRL